MAATSYWNLADLSLIYGGFPLEDTGGEGGKLRIAPVDDDFTDVTGVDGRVTRSANNGNAKADAFITCGQKSPVSSILSTFRTIDVMASNGAGAVPMLAKDANSLDLFAAAACWIIRMPEAEWTKEQKDREWPIRASQITVWILGS